jgi:hypothetical protein
MSKSSSKSRSPFGFTDFVWRLLAATVLVIATYNPSGVSYVHWVARAFSSQGLGAIHLFFGALLLIGWTIFGVATRNSLGALGTILGAALIGTGILLLSRFGLVHADSMRGMAWLALISLAMLLAIGLSWSHVWRRLSGQLEVDDNAN